MDDDEKRFDELRHEWIAIEDSIRQEVLERWTSTLREMENEEDELRAAGKWVRGPADVFGVLGVSRAEVRHTRFIAWLMDPSARHGLGTRFLERTLARCFPGEPFERLDRANPACEVVRAECRVDIVVWGLDFTIVIEAKVDAPEGPAQCDYQYEQFVDEPGSRFIFLSPRGRSPRTATGDAKDAFRPLSFAAIRDDLRAALADGPSDAEGRGAAADYLRTLDKEFPWES